jgi:hypothetical protein
LLRNNVRHAHRLRACRTSQIVRINMTRHCPIPLESPQCRIPGRCRQPSSGPSLAGARRALFPPLAASFIGGLLILFPAQQRPTEPPVRRRGFSAESLVARNGRATSGLPKPPRSRTVGYSPVALLRYQPPTIRLTLRLLAHLPPPISTLDAELSRSTEQQAKLVALP